MNDYTIYCTNEQTKKALELGAKLDYHYAHERIYHSPTGEQMTGWLEEQGIFININYIKDYGYSSWLKSIQDGNHLSENLGYVSSRKEAIFQAIDRALDFLTNKKEK